MDMKRKSNILLTDRSGAETDDQCGMRYWWNRKHGGMGIVPKDEPLALLQGRVTHEDMALVAEADLSDKWLDEAIHAATRDLNAVDMQDQPKMEVLWRRLGWLVAWALFVEPKIRAQYENVQVEHEIILDRTPLWIPVTPDRVLRDRKTGKLVYIEYKTTISASQKWLNSWRYAIQTHIGMAAIAEELKEDVAFTQIVGLMKGNMSYDNMLSHPYVWAWYNEDKNEWTHEYAKARGNGWERMPVWEYPGGLIEWVRLCGEGVARSQFPMTAPIFLDLNMLNNWVQRRTAREKEIQRTLKICLQSEQVRGIIYPQVTSKCRPAFGDACPYLELCWNAENFKNPMRNGNFIPRVPHHDVELTFGGEE